MTKVSGLGLSLVLVSMPVIANAADICAALRLLRYNKANDFGKYRGQPKSSPGKFTGKLKVDGTDSCILTVGNGSLPTRYSCFSDDMDRTQVTQEVRGVIAEVDDCLKKDGKKTTKKDTKSTIFDTEWDNVGNGAYFIWVSANAVSGDWSWSITLGLK